MEENTKAEEQIQTEKEPSTAESLIWFFNNGWEIAVGLVANLFGLKRKIVRDRLLVTIIPFILLLTRVLNWLYLFVHYHLGYNIPIAYLTVDTPWLISFAVGVLFVAVIVLELVLIWIYLDSHVTSISFTGSEWVIIVLSALFIGIFNEFEFFVWFSRGVIWLFFFFSVFLVLIKEREDKAELKKGIAFYITVLLGVLVILAIYIWRIRNILTRWGLEQYINLNLWGGHAFIAYAIVCMVSVFSSFKIEQRDVIRFQICVLFIAAIFSFFLIDDYCSRSAPYAVVTNKQQVIVYQSKEVSVLEAVTIEVDETTDEVTLIIDTSQQQIVDSAALSYEYQSFDTVEIIETSTETVAVSNRRKQMLETIKAAFNRLANLAGLGSSTPADISTDPADGAAFYDTSN